MIKAILIAAIFATTAAHARPREFSIGLAEQQTKGLVAYYPMIVSGTTVLDRSGNGNHGTASGGYQIGYQYGYVGDGYSGDGTDAKISLGNASDLGFSDNQAFTISAWFRTTATGRRDIVVRIRAQSPFPGYAIILNRTTNGRLDIYAGSFLANIGTGLNDGEWHHVAIVLRGDDTLAVWVDGVKAVDTSHTQVTGGDALAFIGVGGTAGTANWFAGEIDEVRIYNYAWTADEVLQRWRDDTVLHRGR